MTLSQNIHSLLTASNFIPVASTASSSTASTSPSSSSSPYESAKACAIVVDGDEGADKNKKEASLDPATVTHSVPPPDGTTFAQIPLGQPQVMQLPPYGYWNVQFYQSEPGYVGMRMEVPRGASLGLYARRNALPTHTNYDRMEVVKGSEDIVKRGIRVSTMSPTWICAFTKVA